MAFVPALSADTSLLRRAAGSTMVLWIAFLLVHLVLGILAFTYENQPLGDVYLVYKPWAQLAASGSIVGINSDWVYPIGAIVPIMLPLLFGADNFVGGWLTLVLLVNAGAFAVLTVGRRPRMLVAAWWWLGFLLVLGPIALGRLDSISAPLVIVGLLWLTCRERVAVVLLTAATWIKVWPAAVIAALVIATKQRWRIAAVAGATSLVLVIVALAFGSGLHVVSFITTQAGRGLQIEAPISTPWMWAAAFRDPHSFVYYDRNILTFQVVGPGSGFAEMIGTPLLGLAVLAVLLVGIRAVRAGAPMSRVVPELSLALVASFIAFNKVGSPQYITWLAASVIVGIIYQGRGFRTPAILVGLTAALTQVVYPELYGYILEANPLMVGVLTVRNLMYFVILGWAIQALWRNAHRVAHTTDEVPAAVWPFAREVAAGASSTTRDAVAGPHPFMGP